MSTLSRMMKMDLTTYCATPSQKRSGEILVDRMVSRVTYGKMNEDFQIIRKSIETLWNKTVVFSYTLETKHGFLYGFHGSIRPHGKLSIEETY